MKDYKVDKESFSESFRKEVYEVVCCWGHLNARGWWDVH